ncbi:MAG: DUF4136 domain-containing protein [Leadbetterella sp.]
MMIKKFTKTSIFAIASFVLFHSCSSNRFYVDNDYSYDVDFTKYSSYTFLNCEIDTNNICTEVQDAIRRQMKARGYKKTDESPGLLVSYSIIKDRVGYRGFQQPTMDRWINKYDQDETYKVQNITYNGGMILVSMIDATSSRLIWRGYASGVFNTQTTKPVNYYRSVVRNIFDQYPLFAAGQKPTKIYDM